jgi:hypothetical protein
MLSEILNEYFNDKKEKLHVVYTVLNSMIGSANTELELFDIEYIDDFYPTCTALFKALEYKVIEPGPSHFYATSYGLNFWYDSLGEYVDDRYEDFIDAIADTFDNDVSKFLNYILEEDASDNEELIEVLQQFILGDEEFLKSDWIDDDEEYRIDNEDLDKV